MLSSFNSRYGELLRNCFPMIDSISIIIIEDTDRRKYPTAYSYSEQLFEKATIRRPQCLLYDDILNVLPGLHDGGTCLCGNELLHSEVNEYTKDQLCKARLCEGNEEEFCGGTNVATIYLLNAIKRVGELRLFTANLYST